MMYFCDFLLIAHYFKPVINNFICLTIIACDKQIFLRWTLLKCWPRKIKLEEEYQNQAQWFFLLSWKGGVNNCINSIKSGFQKWQILKTPPLLWSSNPSLRYYSASHAYLFFSIDSTTNWLHLLTNIQTSFTVGLIYAADSWPNR